MNYSILAFLIVWVFTLSSCGKVKIPIETSPVRNSVKGVIWDTGTWWIYRSDIDNHFDTLEVIAVKQGIAKYATNDKGYNVEYYKVSYKEHPSQKVFSDYYYEGRVKRGCEETNICETGQEILIPETEPFNTPEAHGYTTLEPEPSEYINGFLFHDVYHIIILEPYIYKPYVFDGEAQYRFSMEAGIVMIATTADMYKVYSYNINKLF